MGAATDSELLARVLRNPCRLVVNPTSVTSAYPYGGTGLGEIVDFDLDFEVRYQERRDPASGAIAEVGRRTVEVLRVSLLVQGPAWDEDLLAGAFTKSRSTVVYTSPPETRIEGTVIPFPVAATLPLLIASVDPMGKSALCRRPVLLLPLGRAIAFAQSRKAGLPLVFVATPNSAGAETAGAVASGSLSSPYWQIARTENLTLS